jgi:hypothetical protein
MKRIALLLAVLVLAGGCRTTRMAQETVWLQSSALREATYDYGTHRLSLLFPNGATYAYASVPPRHFMGLKQAECPGSYFHAHIRNRYEATLVNFSAAACR